MTDQRYEAWPDMIIPQNMERLLQMFPTSRLLQIQRMTVSSDRAAAWADLGVTDVAQQAQLEIELDAFIAKLTKDHSHA